MKIGDLVKWSGWLYPMIIVDFKHDVIKAGGMGEKETYYRCMAGNDYIWLFEGDLEVLCK